MERTARDAAVRPATRLVILVAFVLGVAMAQPAPPDGPPGAVAPLSVPLVACDGGEHACVKLKPETSDIVGLWRAYFHHPVLQPVDGLSYVRFHPDGRYNLSATAEQSVDAAAPWPSGTFRLEDGVLTFEAAGGMVIDACVTARYEVSLYYFGDHPVALSHRLIEDACPGRAIDNSSPMVWVAD